MPVRLHVALFITKPLDRTFNVTLLIHWFISCCRIYHCGVIFMQICSIGSKKPMPYAKMKMYFDISDSMLSLIESSQFFINCGLKQW